MSVRNSAASSITSVFGAIATTATTVTTTVDSLNHLATAGNAKARYYAKRVIDNAARDDIRHRTVDETRSAMEMARHQHSLAEELKSSPELAALFQESLELLRGATAPAKA